MLIQPYKPEHPVFNYPTGKAADEFFAEYGEKGWNDLMEARNERILLEEQDPMRYGVELASWALADFVAGRITAEEFLANKTVPPEWKVPALIEEFKDEPATLLLLLGGNRSAKTHYMLKRAVKDMVENAEQDVWVFHENRDQSVGYHQPVIYHHIPQKWKTLGKGAKGYVSYKQKTGFSEMNFVGENGSKMTFKTYEQDIKGIEGGNLGNPARKRAIGFITDELVPQNWADTLLGRIATYNAIGIFGFTPLQGYSPMVAWFRRGARIVIDVLATDLQKPRRVPVVEVKTIVKHGDKPLKMAVVYFHTKLNPYGNYEALKRNFAAATDEQKLIRFYGFCENERQVLFPKLRYRIHGFDPKQLPEDGTRYHYCDPTGVRRNWFMLWALVDPYGRKWVYREWPCPKIHIPGVGFPEPWAVEGQSEKHHHGGLPGGGSRSFGFGLADYKETVAKLEGWDDLRRGIGILDADEMNGAREPIYWRKIDSRFAAVGHYSGDGSTSTLLEESAKIGLNFLPASGKAIDEGLQLINDHLSCRVENWSRPEDGPSLFISTDCVNLWFALNNYTALGGQEEATKDPIDVLRYMMMDDPPYVPQRQRQEEFDRNDKSRFYEKKNEGTRL